MFIDATALVTNLNDEPVMIHRGKKDEDGNPVPESMTVGFVIVEALLIDDERLSATEKLDRFSLAQTFNRPPGGLPIKVDSKDAAKIKDLVAKRWPTLVAGRVIRMIETSPAVAEVPAVQAAE